MTSSLETSLNSSLRLNGGGGSAADVARLMQENMDLKRQMSGGAFSASCQIAYEDLDVQDQIGGGGFSLVYRGFWKGTPVAIKKWFDPSATDQMMQEFREEVMILQEMRHPNILQFLGAVMKPPHLCMVTEHLPFSLHSVLYNGTVEFDRKRAVALAQDICRAFIYLHSRKPCVVHRDIKPANFLVDRSWKVKLCDFGLASNSRSQAGAGTPAYMAPELLEGKSFNEKVDVYAFGVMLNEMLAKEMPYSGSSVGDIKAAVLLGQRPDIPLSCPKALAEIVKKCWAQEAAARPAFDKLLEQLKDAAKTL